MTDANASSKASLVTVENLAKFHVAIIAIRTSWDMARSLEKALDVEIDMATLSEWAVGDDDQLPTMEQFKEFVHDVKSL